MREKLNKLKARYEELGRLLSSPDAMADMDAWKELNRERVQLEEIVAVSRPTAGRCWRSTWMRT